MPKPSDFQTYHDFKRTLKKNKTLSLLIALVVFIVVLPLFENNSMGIFYLVFFTALLLTGIYAVSYNIRHVAGGVLLAVPTLITAWSNVFVQDRGILNAEMVFLTIFLSYTMFVMLRHILFSKKVTINELYSAICVYVMVGMTFGVIYALLYSLDPGSIAFPPGETVPRLTSFFYFSFVSMSSTGFSGFTAVSGLARSIVIVQVIIGVMYVSTLIGKLVSANTPNDDGLFDNLEGRLKAARSSSLAENHFRNRMFLLVLSMAMLNYSSSVLMTVLKMPIFLDSWGTSLGVVLGGLPAGILAGVIYNVVMALTFWAPSSWVWSFSNVFIAVATWLLWKKGWIDLYKPGKLVCAGVICGVLNSGAVMLTEYLADFPIYQGTMVVYHFFMKMTSNPSVASVAEKMVVEVADKTIALFLVAVAVIFIQDLLGKQKAQEA